MVIIIVVVIFEVVVFIDILGFERVSIILWFGDGRRKSILGRDGWVIRDKYICVWCEIGLVENYVVVEGGVEIIGRRY